MQYDEISLQITSNPSGGYEVTVLESPFGRTQGSAEVAPAAAEQAATLDARLAEEEMGRDQPAATRETLPRDLPDLRNAWGFPLFTSLFLGKVADYLYSSLGRMKTRRSEGDRCGLRIRLIFGAPSPTLAMQDSQLKHDVIRFATAPWEYLCDPRNGSFLALSLQTPVVRSVDSPEIVPAVHVKPPLNVLVVMSTPSDMKQLDLHEEKRRILGAIEGHDHMHVRCLENKTFEEVVAELERESYHILHFMGHGGFRRGSGEGELFFVGEDKLRQPKTGEDIVFELNEFGSTLRLVVLNACRGGEITRSDGLDPFGSVALSLTASGIPAVVAMQYPISDRAAIAFSGEFYQELSAGLPVDRALAAARREMKHVSSEWGTPVLYLRQRDGQLFDFEPAPSLAASDDRDAAPEERVVRLGIRSMSGLQAAATAECDFLLDLVPYFNDRFIRRARDWNGRIFSKIQAFLARYATDRTPIELVIPAHASIAFAAGYCLEAKSGHDLRLYQGGPKPAGIWRLGAGTVPSGRLWREEAAREVDPSAEDVALVVSVTKNVLQDVCDHLEESGTAVRQILHAAVIKPGLTRVEGGEHAWRLAEELAQRIQREARRPGGGVLHIFLCAPNTLSFFLGRLARPFGRVQLYEYDFEQSRGGGYTPSISIVPRSLGKVEKKVRST